MKDRLEVSVPFSQWKCVHFLGKINLDLDHQRLYRYELFSWFKES